MWLYVRVLSCYRARWCSYWVQAVSWGIHAKTELIMVASRAGLVMEAGFKVTTTGGDRPGKQHFGD